jgi:hypothetical protein
MSKHEEASLILKLYDLRREETMRKARDWFFREFNPQSLADMTALMFSENSAYVRMVLSYWDMAAALVNHGAISVDLFNETNGEHLGVFSKLEPILEEARAAYDPKFLSNLEKLVDATPNGRERIAKMRDRMRAIRSEIAPKSESNGSAETVLPGSSRSNT